MNTNPQKKEAARLHLNASFEWNAVYKKAFKTYLEKGGCFWWGGYQNQLTPTIIQFSSVDSFLKEINDPDTCLIFQTRHHETIIQS